MVNKLPEKLPPLILPVHPVERVHKDSKSTKEHFSSEDQRKNGEALQAKDFSIGSNAPELKNEFKGLEGRVVLHSIIYDNSASTYSKRATINPGQKITVLLVEITGPDDELVEYEDKYLLVHPDGTVLGSRPRLKQAS